MKPELRRIHSPDVDDLEGFAPRDPRRFGLLIQLMIGPVGMAGEESFDVVVCTPAWLEEASVEHRVMTLRHHLLVRRYDLREIVAFVEGFLEKIEADSWREVAERVGRLGRWEFEDYKP